MPGSFAHLQFGDARVKTPLAVSQGWESRASETWTSECSHYIVLVWMDR